MIPPKPSPDALPDAPPDVPPRATPEDTPRKGYHHGALREALLSAARRLIAEKGVAGFNLADASRLAGVSGAAPYRHFRDKDELVREVARLGFTAFGERLAEAAREAAAPGGASDGANRGVEAFKAMGRAYLGFARTEPGAYAAMFSFPHAGPQAGGDAALSQAGERAFGVLVEGINRALGGHAPATGDATRLAFQIWALAHGVAMLDKDGAAKATFDAEAALLDGVERLLRPDMTPRA